MGSTLLLAALLYPVIGAAGCAARVVLQGRPPDPFDPAYEEWLSYPVRSFTTEAVIIPLVMLAKAVFSARSKKP